MPEIKPFKRTCRQFANGSYVGGGGDWMYVGHPDFAKEPDHYIRAFNLIQEDLYGIFEYVEPASANLKCYSYRIHALHMRTCIEIEANCKAILNENGYSRKGDWNMPDYRKLEATHHLSAYEIKLPIWRDTQPTWQPFYPWSTNSSLPWYEAYNAAKHDRHDEFPNANFHNLLDAVCALVALLASQFYTGLDGRIDWMNALGEQRIPTGFRTAIGGYFYVKFPNNWPLADRYNFSWDILRTNPNPIQTLTL